MTENSAPKSEPVQQKPSAADAKAEVKNTTEKLERLERTTGRSGAVPNAPKQMLLEAPDAVAQHPDKRLRWGSLSNPDKMEVRKAEGYERLPVSEGGKQVGNMVLLALPREEYEARVRRILEENERRLTLHNHEVEAVAEQVAKVLRDKYGLRIPAEDIIIRG